MSWRLRMRTWCLVVWLGPSLAVIAGCKREAEKPATDATSGATPKTQPSGFGGWTTTQPWPGGTAPAGHGSYPAATGSSPATQPGVSPTSPVQSFRPLLDAVEGEWAVYAAMHSRTVRYEIVKVAADVVGTRVTVYEQGKPLGLPAVREDRRDADLLAEQAASAGAQRGQRTTTTDAAGRQWDVILYEDRWTDEGVQYVRRTWVSTDAPVFGVIRMELHGDGVLEARLKLVEMGGKK